MIIIKLSIEIVQNYVNKYGKFIDTNKLFIIFVNIMQEYLCPS